MRDEWYVARRGQDGNKRYGPVPVIQLRQLLDSGQVRGEDLVWRDGMAGWQAADRCPELGAPARPDPRGYGQDAGPRGYGRYGDDRPYRRPYPQQSSAWVLPVVIVGSVLALGVLGAGGLLCIALVSSRPTVAPATSTSFQPVTQPWENQPPIPAAPDWAPPPDPPVFVDPNPPIWIPPPDPRDNGDLPVQPAVPPGFVNAPPDPNPNPP